ncbi:hypothetical protein [Nostoc sp.]|uniref:hypothetical protein n=1 Tax=Nostoc sp. TaxID=1180 RepID=UPI002FF7EA5B
MTTKAKRELIQITGIEVEVFQLPDRSYTMSQTQAAQAVGKSESSVRRFLAQKNSKGNDSKGFQFAEISVEKDWEGQGNNQTVKAIPIDIVFKFWVSQIRKGNAKAEALVSACGEETLHRRCDTAFGQVKSEQQYEQQSVVNRQTYAQERQYLRDSHTVFELACIRWKFSAAQAHDLITTAVCGKTAAELRMLDVIDGTADVGLNHISNLGEMKRVADAKRLFSKYRKGDVNERIIRALKDMAK